MRLTSLLYYAILFILYSNFCYSSDGSLPIEVSFRGSVPRLSLPSENTSILDKIRYSLSRYISSCKSSRLAKRIERDPSLLRTSHRVLSMSYPVIKKLVLETAHKSTVRKEILSIISEELLPAVDAEHSHEELSPTHRSLHNRIASTLYKSLFVAALTRDDKRLFEDTWHASLDNNIFTARHLLFSAILSIGREVIDYKEGLAETEYDLFLGKDITHDIPFLPEQAHCTLIDLACYKNARITFSFLKNQLRKYILQEKRRYNSEFSLSTDLAEVGASSRTDISPQQLSDDSCESPGSSPHETHRDMSDMPAYTATLYDDTMLDKVLKRDTPMHESCFPSPVFAAILSAAQEDDLLKYLFHDDDLKSFFSLEGFLSGSPVTVFDYVLFVYMTGLEPTPKERKNIEKVCKALGFIDGAERAFDRSAASNMRILEQFKRFAFCYDADVPDYEKAHREAAEELRQRGQEQYVASAGRNSRGFLTTLFQSKSLHSSDSDDSL